MDIPSFLLPTTTVNVATSGIKQSILSSLRAIGGATSIVRLPFFMQGQLQSNWCWSAVSTSVAYFFDAASQWTQCTVANLTLGQTTCCAQGNSATCNQPWFLDAALGVVGHFGRMLSAIVSFHDVQSEVGHGRPVAIRVAWNAFSAHFLIVDGWSITGSGRLYYYVSDSIFGSSRQLKSQLETAYQKTGTWTHTYFVEQAGSGSSMVTPLAGRDPGSIGG